MSAILAVLLALPDVGLGSMYVATRSGRPYADGSWPRPGDRACAHRTAPLGARLRITHRRRSTTCIVRDRGPWGACVPAPGHRGRRCPAGYRWRAPRRLPPGAWRRGVLDATPAVWRSLGVRGWVRVRIELAR